MNIESIRNYQEQAVFEQVRAQAGRFPAFAANDELLADVACVALNALPPRYIRHVVDMHFFMSNRERAQNDAAVRSAVETAFNYIAKRVADEDHALRAGS